MTAVAIRVCQQLFCAGSVFSKLYCKINNRLLQLRSYFRNYSLRYHDMPLRMLRMVAWASCSMQLQRATVAVASLG